ncbi:helix-turn-helix domain-containing protein [Streptomyces sp.]|uniref:winged helix-turn-helix domain-containing protein n=1 Tax=Streptomyces sp. TaxID=1931 RepID=UPI0028123822|nr:helix-turn-helix domain-containing protein [Streptomyces sp.]
MPEKSGPRPSEPRPGEEQPRSIRLTDPRALRAYAHPLRLTLVGLLRSNGPFTATRAAALTGESVASCSYHLRILAKYGLVEEAPGGHGRQKPWRATAQYTEWPEYSEDPAVAEAADALSAAVAERYFERFTRAMENRRGIPKEWREAEQLGDSLLHLTPGELADLGKRIEELLRPYEERENDRSLRPEGARAVSIMRIAYLDQDVPADEKE